MSPRDRKTSRKRSALGRGFVSAPANPDGSAPWTKPREPEHGTGDVLREHVTRVADASRALGLLEHATRMASEARSLLAAIVGGQHHATAQAAAMVSAGMKAQIGAEQVLRTVKR